MTTYTPGPFPLKVRDLLDGRYTVVTNQNTFFAETCSGPNARLITAAPELLRELKISHGKDHPGLDVCGVCALIAEAEGK